MNNRKLLKQTVAEWRQNVWIGVELLVVSVVVWLMTDYFYVTYRTASEPRGFDIEHTYLINIGELMPENPEYQEKDGRERSAEKQELITRLRRRNEVQYAAWSINSYPYNGSTMASEITYSDSITTGGFLLRRIVDPEFVEVFRYEGINGESPEYLRQALEKESVIVSDNVFHTYEDSSVSISNIKGDTLTFDYGERRMPVYTSTKPVKYSDGQWDLNSTKYMAWNLYDYPEWGEDAYELTVRVKPNMDKDFARNLMADAEKQLKVGNIFINSVTEMSEIRDRFLTGWYQKQRQYGVGMAFMLINIFLGLLGTFWFRTQQRVKEIAVRKVNGASRRSIFARFIGEGLIILTAVTLVAAGIDALLVKNDVYTLWRDFNNPWPRFAMTISITYAVMAVMIVAGIAIPAYKAMKVEPAKALHDE